MIEIKNKSEQNQVREILQNVIDTLELHGYSVGVCLGCLDSSTTTIFASKFIDKYIEFKFIVNVRIDGDVEGKFRIRKFERRPPIIIEQDFLTYSEFIKMIEDVEKNKNNYLNMIEKNEKSKR